MIPMLRTALSATVALTVAAGLVAQTSGRTNQLTSAPVLGGTMNVTVNHPTTEAGNPYVVLWSPHTNAVTNLNLPFIQGLLRLDINALGTVFSGTLGATGKTTTPIPIPNTPAFLDAQFDMQSVDLNIGLNTVYLADTDMTPHFVNGIGTTVTVQGSIASLITGNFTFQTVSNSDMSAPTNGTVPTSAFQIIRHYGQKGYVEGFAGNFSSTQGNSDIHLWRRDRVVRNLVNGAMQVISLPNGFDFGILRDTANCKQFSLVSISRATGTASVLSGSVVTDTTIACPPTTTFSMYQPQVAFTDDGEVAVLVVHDSSNSATPNVGPPDKVVLVKTDPAKKWTNGLNVLDVSPTGTEAMHTWYNGNLRIGNEMFFCEGEDAGGVTGEAVLYAGPIDGSSPMKKLAVPLTGTNLPFYWSYSNWRVSQDGKTMVFAIGGNSTSSTTDQDVIAVTNISKAGPMTVSNVSKFATPTRVQSPNGGNLGSIGPSQIKWSLSPDGAWLVFTTGLTSAASPDQLWITKTDGTTAPTQITTASVFAAGHLFFGSTEFVSNTKFVFLGGASSTFCDWYVCDISTPATPVVSKLTNTSNQNVQPYATGGNVYNRGHFWSRNRQWLYFIRGNGTSAVIKNDLVAINAAALVLKDITGSEFSSGTAPALYRGPSLTALSYTTNPWPALEWQVRTSPVGNEAFFVAEVAAGATSTVYNDCNVFKFDMENAGQAVQLTTNTGQGALTAVKGINYLTISPDGQWVAWAQRLQTSGASEDVFLLPAAGGTPKQLSVTNFVNGGATAGQTIVDGSLAFTGSPVDGLAWAIGTGSISVPFNNAAVQWARLNGTQDPPFLLTPVPTATPNKIFMVLTANPKNY